MKTLHKHPWSVLIAQKVDSLQKQRYTPGDSWHDDANTKQFKGSQGKSGTYLLRLTDWLMYEVYSPELFTIKRFVVNPNCFFSEVSEAHRLSLYLNKIYRFTDKKDIVSLLLYQKVMYEVYSPELFTIKRFVVNPNCFFSEVSEAHRLSLYLNKIYRFTDKKDIVSLLLYQKAAHGVLEVHKVNDCHSGRIHSFYNEISSVGLITKSKLYRKNLSRSKFYLSPPKPCFNYPLIQRDIQLKNCTTLDVKMNSKVRKENDLKYTSTNLKQKRRELRECKALSLSRGRHSCGTLNEHSKKNRSTRIKSTKQEQYESAKTLFHNNVSPFASSMGRSKNKISSSATSSWQRDHRRSCKNSNIFSRLSVIDRNEPHIRFSVRGTRIFGRRKSYRACPALKGDARSNGAFIKSRSSSLPCELSQVESHDYEFWNSGFVQSRVRKLEEELTAKCEDKFSYNYDYEVQSLCSLNLQKIQPDGDDYRIAYLSSTSQESSLDYMDDNYCSIGMGTLDVKLNKKYVIAGNEDWDLSFSSEENETTSEDDDEFFYRKYTNGGVSQSQMFKCIPGNYCISNDYDSTELSATKYGKKCSNNMGAGDTEDSNSSIIQQIHENVDRIFYNVMQYDFDIPQPIQEKPNKLFTLEYSSYLTNDGNKDENENLFQEKETINQNQLMNFNSSAVSEDHYKSNFSRNNGLNGNIVCSSEEYSLLNARDFSPQNELLKNNSADDSLDCSHKSFDNNQISTIEQFSEFNILNITPLETGDNQPLNEKLSDNLFSNSSSIEADNTLNNLFTENEYWKNDDSNCVVSENDSPVRKTSGYIINASTSNILQSTQEQLRNSEIKASETEKNLFHVNNEPDTPKITLKNSDCIDYSFLSFNEVKATSDHVINCDEHILNKCNNLKKEIVALSKIPHSNKNPSKYKLKRNKWFEESKLTNVFPQTKSVLEVELERYEPLCTPFAEIYFITYGKNYPTTSSYKLDVQRKLLPDSEKEVEISINDQNVFTDTEEISEFDKLNRTRHATKICANKNYQDTSISNSKRKCKNSESHSADILPISNVNEHKSLISIYHNAKITEQNRNTFSDNCFTTFLQNEKVLLYLFNKKHPIIIFRGLEELFQNVTQLMNCHSENNPMSNIFYNKFSDDCKALGDSKYLFYNQSKIKLFLFKWLELGKRLYRENKKGTANSANLLVSNSNLSNFSSSTFLNIISIVQLLNILSPLFFTSKHRNKLYFPNFEPRQRKQCVDKTNRLINVKTISQTETQSKFIPDFCTSETNLHQKSLKYYDIRSRIHSKRESNSKLKKNIGVHSSETNKKLSKNIYRLKNKKCYRSKGMNLYKNSTNYLRKNEKKCLVWENHKNEYTSVTKKPGVCKQKQRTRNRNYRFDNYFLRETEISIEAPQAGENSFVAESLANLTTSPTSNATFVKYLFPPQLVSVRDTAKTRLSGSSIQHIQSVPAVQRLADRESRFTQSVKNHKHGSFRAATASVAAKITDSDCFCGSQDFCVLESICGGYPVALNSCKTEKITTQDHDFEDYVCFGSVPKGLQQLICDQVIFGDAKWITLNPTSVPLFESLQNMATCEENPRLKSKVIRTPGKNISKLRKLFDAGESGVSDSDTLCSKKDDNKSLSSQSTNVNNTQNTEHKSEISERLSDIVNKIDTSLNNDFPEISKNETVTNTPQQRVSSDIPYCRQISKSGDLWKNVDIGVKSSNDGLWGSAPNNDYNSNDSFDHTDLRHGNNSFVSSTTDLHNLIAASKAELSKKKEPLLSDKSTLENYFTSFENSKPKKFVPLSSTDQSILTNDFSDHEISNSQNFKTSVTYDCDVSNSQNFKTSVTYDCDAEEMIFDEEDAVFSDTSSDEEIRCNPNLNNTHYLPAYALHTIIEESCEESERDSRNTTPTNEPVTSKLERYFSWDIINDTETDVKRKDDESTVYSDSLSEGSGSLNGDASKEIDPTQLASSRLEKYFTSGLVGNENYFYPDDAEFLEDGPVSDFEEDSIHQKISRSALLSSLENVTEKQESEDNESFEMHEKESESGDRTMSENVEQLDCDIVLKHDSDSNKIENDNVKTMPNQDSEKEVFTTDQEIVTNDLKQECEEIEKIETTKLDEITVHTSNSFTDVILSSDLDNAKDSKAETKSIQKSDSELVENIVDKTDVSIPKPSVCKEQLAVDVRAIIKKLLVYFSDSEPNSFKHNVETDYISAWQILETEIERLIQSISPAASIENNSCNSSTIDSNNSDYGSDTVESLECMTDEDESADSKNRGNAKYPIVDLLNAAYKIQPGSEFHNFNISDETLSIWKRLIQSLQKDSFCMNDKLYDPNTEARLYIRDQIVNLMHTVTVNENKVGEIDSKISNIEDGEITSLIEEKTTSVDINEAFNVSVSAVPLLYSNDETLYTSKTEYFDDRISIETSENLETVETINNISDDEPKISNEFSSDIKLDSDLKLSFSEPPCVDIIDKDESPQTHETHFEELSYSHSEEINVNEIDIELNLNSPNSSDKKPIISSHIDINLNKDVSNSAPEKCESHLEVEYSEVYDAVKRSSLHMWISGETECIEKEEKPHSDTVNPISQKEDSLYVEDEISDLPEATRISGDANDFRTPGKSCRDTGYYSFKSSDDSILHDTPPPDEFMDVPNFKSLKRSVKKFPLANTLSKSSTNINQVFSVPDNKFSTLQLKNQKAKGSSNSSNSPSRQFTSLFSPTAVFKKLTGSKVNETNQTPESSIPSKYLKKYARSPSVETESMIGAISMPQLNCPRAGDSYSALGLYSENDRDSSLIADDDVEVKKYPAYSQSVLSLGAHSVSMTSVYSAAACHYGYVTVSGDVLFGLNYNQKSQMMEVFVKQCRNLAAVDIKRNKSDPYVKVYLLPDKTKGGKRKTKTKKNTLSPVFNELLRFPVLKHELEARTLWLSVWNSDLFGRNDFLGEVMLPLGYRLLDSPTLRWYPLQERMESLTSPLNYRGELFLALKYVPRDLSLESRFRPAPVISLRGALHVLVKEARNISANGSGGNLDAFCKSYLLPDKSKSSKQKTPVVKRSRHPKWYYTMIYEDLTVDELKERSLELTVWDHDKITSNEFMGGIRLNLGSGLYHGVSVEWMDSRRDEAALWEAMLQSPNMWVDGCLPLRPTMHFHHG